MYKNHQQTFSINTYFFVFIAQNIIVQMVKLVWEGAINVYPEQFEHLNSNKSRVTYISAVKFYICCKPMIGQVANVFTNQPFCVGYLICHCIIPNFILILLIHTRHFGCFKG